MNVSNQYRRILNKFFGPKQQKREEKSTLSIGIYEQSSVQGIFQVILWMLSLPAITLILLLFMK